MRVPPERPAMQSRGACWSCPGATPRTGAAGRRQRTDPSLPPASSAWPGACARARQCPAPPQPMPGRWPTKGGAPQVAAAPRAPRATPQGARRRPRPLAPPAPGHSPGRPQARAQKVARPAEDGGEPSAPR
eukprot:348103-Alexandrium_andersonii.AAC.1